MPTFQIPVAELRKHRLFVATPMYGGMCNGPYTKSCLDLVALASRYGVQTQFYFLFNESLITRARNYLVDEFLRSDATHLLFIDSDIDFNAMDVMAMLAFDKDIIGAPYPKKTIAWEKVFDAVTLGAVGPKDSPLRLEDYTGDYVFNLVPGTTEVKLDAPIEVLEIGTGFMMIKREVFPVFKEKYPERAFKPDHNRSANFNGSRMVHAYFDTVICPDTQRYLSEDYMFCQWSRKIGFKIHLCPWMKLKHIGSYVFGGSVESMAQLSMLQRDKQFSTPVSTAKEDTVQR